MDGFAARYLGWWATGRRFLCLPGRGSPFFSSKSSTGACDPIGEGAEPYIPVLIVGAGPVGLVLSLLLTKLGVKCAVLEKNPAFSQHPQAHFINNRSMELFRKMDGLAEDIQKLQPPVDLWRKFIYCTSVSGTILGSVDHMQAQDFDKKESPVSVAHYSQYKLIRLLLKKLERRRGFSWMLNICEEIIFKLVGWKLDDVEVKDIKPWAMHAEVAEKYVSWNDRVILVGDAAHRFPPAGGFGMNTGIQDAHNLAWKIRLLLDNVASTSIIKSYEIERRPIAIFNTTLSVENFKSAMSIPAALGVDPTIANLVQRVMNSFGSIFPDSFQKFALERIFSLGRAQLSPFILNEKNPIGSVRLARLKKIFDDGKSLQLQFPAEDLGFRYIEGALVAQNNDKTWERGCVNCFKRGSRSYVASSKPGARLPHMQIKALRASSSEDLLSTLDLVLADKIEFLLIIAPVKESYDLACMAFKAAENFNVPLKVCIIWPHGSSSKIPSCSSTELEPWRNYIDVVEVKSRCSGSWWEMCHLSSNGVLLVRPDEHIAWSTESNNIEDSACELEKVFSLIMGKSPS